ncbi:hypothetical protein JDV02_007694 [Purpureocillium takamizusanense]|uniref:Uncharacterized protein n=1 Tax=Purpureocillium takamizusanense TaxID=2060973 RepID=A0A9Q8QN29_9HYPO|nr:uncharacterized protein JDV02_007694 [Purpureocillium takamizusanense]UNI21734.1 hypothetical protein JDV02_007694 [Purpureocillium takamizusanense]
MCCIQLAKGGPPGPDSITLTLLQHGKSRSCGHLWTGSPNVMQVVDRYIHHLLLQETLVVLSKIVALLKISQLLVVPIQIMTGMMQARRGGHRLLDPCKRIDL